MAAANKPTAVHFSLVVFVTLTLILGVVTYLYVKKTNEAEAKLVAQQSEQQELQRNYDSRVAEITDLKAFLGYDFDQLGSASAGDANSVYPALVADTQAAGRNLSANTVRATLAALRTALDGALTENQALNDSLNENRTQLVSVEAGAQRRVDEFKSSQDGSEQQLQGRIATHEGQIKEKQGEIDRWKNDYNVVQSEKVQVSDEFERFRRETAQRVSLLEKQIDFYKDRLDEVTKQSYEREDGHIVSVDNTTRTVWIDLGKADNLREQVTFSVYSHDHRGLGRNPGDIKAKIQVTRIIEPHLAVAQILDEDLFRPISEGDPIFTPLWSAGRKEYFAVVGRPDLDEDGKSDWDLFNEIVHNAGAEVEFYVNDEAVRVPEGAKLSARTKYLIEADIDDPLEFSGQKERQDLAIKIKAQQEALRDEARLYGIRVIRLNDFLEFVGWQPQQRLWRPGQRQGYNLRSGTPEGAVDDAFRDRSPSGGTTSELFRTPEGSRSNQP